jgi:hypothetical protein
VPDAAIDARRVYLDQHLVIGDLRSIHIPELKDVR